MVAVSVLGYNGSLMVQKEMDDSGINGLLIHNGDNTPVSDDVYETVCALNQVEAASEITMLPAYYSISAKDECVIWGIDSFAADLISLKPTLGRYFSQKEFMSHNRVCMVDEATAAQIYPDESAVGKVHKFYFNGSACEFEIIGVIKTGGGILQNLTSYLPKMVFCSRNTLSSLTGICTGTQIAVGLSPDSDSETVRSQLAVILNDTSLVVENLAKQKENLTSVVNTVSVVITFTGFVSVLVSGIGMMITMLMSVSERTKEIGIKKALGAQKTDILREFLLESAVIMLFGAVVGIIPIYGITAVISAVFDMQIAVAPKTVLLILGAVVLCSPVFGAYPAYKAAQLKPYDALNR